MEAEGVKFEEWTGGYCQCCLVQVADSTYFKDLSTPVDSTRDTSYHDLLMACFSIQLITGDIFDDSQCSICITCVDKLKETFSFRCQIEDSQIKLKGIINKIEDSGLSKITDLRNNFENENFLKCEFPSDDDDLNPDFDSIEIPELNIKKDTKRRVIVRSKSVSAKTKPSPKKKIITTAEKKDTTPVTSKNAFDVAINNLLHPEENSSSRRRNKVKIMSENDFKNYRRLYYRVRYAKSIPFKLDETAVKCDICSEKFNTHKQLVSHMSIHYPNHICDLCGKSFVIKEQLTGHMRTHCTEKRTCQICNKVLKKSSMTRHMRTHTGNNEVYACPSCPERFVSFSTRVNHMAEKHNVDKFKYNCTICSKKFHLASSLSKHIRRCHFQELNAKCPECGKGFFDKKSLKNHMLIHTGERKFQCEVCLKSYGRKCTIREHMKIHNNIKQHKCTMCDKAFAQRGTLKGHLKTHKVKEEKCSDFNNLLL